MNKNLKYFHTIMMKEYIEPELDVLEIKSQNMLFEGSTKDTQEEENDDML